MIEYNWINSASNGYENKPANREAQFLHNLSTIFGRPGLQKLHRWNIYI